MVCIERLVRSVVVFVCVKFAAMRVLLFLVRFLPESLGMSFVFNVHSLVFLRLGVLCVRPC